jgi:hypothetical protein
MTGATLADEGFLRRWARRKTEVRTGTAPMPEAPAPAAVPALADAPAAAPVPLPTMDDVARLTRDSDFSAFVARGVDAAVRRTALKTLFADPHFNTMDGLDVYIGDYTTPSPMSEAMLASLAHAQQVLRRAVDAVAEDSGPRPGDPPEAA